MQWMYRFCESMSELRSGQWYGWDLLTVPRRWRCRYLQSSEAENTSVYTVGAKHCRIFPFAQKRSICSGKGTTVISSFLLFNVSDVRFDAVILIHMILIHTPPPLSSLSPYCSHTEFSTWYEHLMLRNVNKLDKLRGLLCAYSHNVCQ